MLFDANFINKRLFNHFLKLFGLSRYLLLVLLLNVSAEVHSKPEWTISLKRERETELGNSTAVFSNVQTGETHHQHHAKNLPMKRGCPLFHFHC